MRKTALGLAVLITSAACDDGSSIETFDWKGMESRLSVLEQENTTLKAQLDERATVAELAGYARLADLEECVREADLAAYAKLEDLPENADLSLYALESELAAYARTSDLPDLSGYALRSELSGFVTAADLEPYALDADLSAFDDVIHLIPDDVTKTIPGDFPTLNAAFAWAQHFSLARGKTLTFQLADSESPYVFDAPLNANHRDGGLIQILGNAADPSKVVLHFPTSNGIVIRSNRLGLVNGVTIRGGRGQDQPVGMSGVVATEGGVVRLGANVIIEDFTAFGVRATFNAYVQAGGVTARNNGLDGFNAVDGATIFAPSSLAEDNGRDGYNAAIGAIIDANNARALDNGRIGFNAFGNAVIYSVTAAATGHGSHGMVSNHGALLFVPNANASDNNGHGVTSFMGGFVDAANGTFNTNAFNGLNGALGATINANTSRANDNGQSGYAAWLGSAMQVAGSESRRNAQHGYASWLGSAMQAGVIWSSGVSTVAEANGSDGYVATAGAMMEAIAAQSIDNGGGGFSAWLGASINAGVHGPSGKASRATGNTWTGFAAGSGSAIEADGATSAQNGGDGFQANLGSVLRANMNWALATDEVAPLPAVAQSNGGRGFDASSGSSLQAQGAHALGNAGHGLSAHFGSNLATNQDWTDHRAVVSDNGGHGYLAWIGSAIDTGGALISRSGNDAVHATIGSAIQANGVNTDVSVGGGVTAWHTSTVIAGAALIKNVTNGHGIGAYEGSSISAYDSRVEDIGGTGYHASGNSTIHAANAEAVRTWNGFSAWTNSFLEVNGSRSEGANGNAYRAQGESSIAADRGVATDTTSSCFLAHDTSSIAAANSSAVECGGHGYEAWKGSTITADNAVATSPAWNGFSAWGNSGLTGSRLTVTDCGQTGIAIGTGSFASMSDVTVTGCDQSGISVSRSSFLEANASDLAEGLRSRTNGNGQDGVQVDSGSFASLYGLESHGNQRNAATVSSLSGLGLNWASLTGSVTGLGLSAVGTTWLNANWSLIEDNGAGGVNCAGSSYCAVTNAIVRNNTGVVTPYNFGLNVFWDAWFDVTGTVSTGHQYDTNLPRESQPLDWGPIYDRNAPAAN